MKWDPPQPPPERKPAPIDKQAFGFPIWGWLLVAAAIVIAVGWSYDPISSLFG